MIKKIIKFILPKFFFNFLKKINDDHKLEKFKNLPIEETFKKIYEEKLWTPNKEE